MTNAYELSSQARKAIARWSRDEFYVYIRPTTSKWSEPGNQEGQWWVVTVQVRGVPPHEFREEGRSLDRVICKLDGRVPRRSELSDFAEMKATEHIGFLAPHALWEKKYKRISQDRSASPALRTAAEWSKQARKDARSKQGHHGVLVDAPGEGRHPDATKKGHATEQVKSKKKKKKSKKGKK